MKQERDWLFIEALEQPRFSPLRGWHSYPGWVHLSEVSEETKNTPTQVFIGYGKNLLYGTWLHQKESSTRPFSTPFSRKKLLEEASYFIDTPYLWGGKAYYSENPIAGVDCSGLTYLLYKAQGILIPRDAHDQFLYCQKITKEELQEGDLIFWAPVDKPERITHVVLYVDKDHFIEAPFTKERVRSQRFPSDFWKDKQVHHFLGREKPHFVFCGRVPTLEHLAYTIP